MRQFREALDLTQEQLAHRAGITAKYVSEIENAHVNTSIDMLGRVVEDGFRVPLSAFFAEAGGGVKDDLDQLAALFGGQSAARRRVALRILRALCDD
jgi:transcriptional regulator with XRE-family HTH domain